MILQTYLYSNNNISILSEIQVILVVQSNIDSNAIFIHTDVHTQFAIGLYYFSNITSNITGIQYVCILNTHKRFDDYP